MGRNRAQRDSLVHFVEKKRAAAAVEDADENLSSSDDDDDESSVDDPDWPIWDDCVDGEGDGPRIADCERIRPVRGGSSAAAREREDKSDGVHARRCFALDCFDPWKTCRAPPAAATEEEDEEEEEMDYEKEDGGADSEEAGPPPPARLSRRKGGVIKRASMVVQRYMGMPASARMSFHPGTYVDRDCLLDEEEDQRTEGKKTKTKGEKKNRRVRFHGTKRVLKMAKITDEDESVWWTYEDYDRFKGAMTLLIQKVEAPDYHNFLQSGGVGEANEDRQQIQDRAGGKWYHDYDHSRRGLERYANPTEARQRVASLKMATRKTIEEQDRQRRFFLPYNNPEKISKIYKEYSSWSRDMALAFGASDADAVQTNFDEEKRHSREHYFLKQIIAAEYKIHRNMPQFMVVNGITPRGFIDEAVSTYSEKAAANARKRMSTLSFNMTKGPLPPALSAAASFSAKKIPNEQDEKSDTGVQSSNTSSSMPKEKTRTKRATVQKMASNYPFSN